MVEQNWARLWFEEYIKKKKSLAMVSKETGITVDALIWNWSSRSLPIRNRSLAQKVRYRRKDATSSGES
tara:strand:- start:1384 stop:1590 length:207 start_codon:yes stop_codon:yes gene_type:complete